MGYVYLIHFEPKYKHAYHYIGFSEKHPLSGRIAEHINKTAKGSPLIKAALEAGCEITNISIWTDVDRNFERSLKKQGASRRCNKCKLLKKA